jgi:hypothetical protein
MDSVIGKISVSLGKAALSARNGGLNRPGPNAKSWILRSACRFSRAAARAAAAPHFLMNRIKSPIQ